jgi:uncharacterized Zn finger protein
MAMAGWTAADVRRLAGSRFYQRGEAYFREGRVHNLRVDQGRVSATVAGTHRYRVTLGVVADGVEFTCTCPVGMEGDFCKHCVATALASLATPAPDQPPADEAQSDRVVTDEEVRGWLMRQEREVLVDLVMEAAAEDGPLSHRLMLQAAASGEPSLATYRTVLEQAIVPDTFMSYGEMYDYWRGANHAIDGLAALLDQGHGEAVIELSEHALACAESATQDVDDSDGYLGGLFDRLQELHLAACRQARPDPEELAERLFWWEVQGDWDTFFGTAERYAEVLGERGLATYRQLAEAVWAEVPARQPRDRQSQDYGRRWRITHLMEALARQAGDVDALVAVMEKDLSTAHAFARIVDAYHEAGRAADAVAWAERGINAFGDLADPGVQDFLADHYHRERRHDDALTLIWPRFARTPGVASYRDLKRNAKRANAWPQWRQRAVDHLHARIDEEEKEVRRTGWRGGFWSARSTLVEILLWEKRQDEAWEVARGGHCRQELWLKLAALREQDHPRDAIAVYQRLVDPIVDRKDKQAYAEASGLLRRIRDLMASLEEDAAFRGYLTTVRATHKRKRNFMALLDALG